MLKSVYHVHPNDLANKKKICHIHFKYRALCPEIKSFSFGWIYFGYLHAFFFSLKPQNVNIPKLTFESKWNLKFHSQYTNKAHYSTQIKNGDSRVDFNLM